MWARHGIGCDLPSEFSSHAPKLAYRGVTFAADVLDDGTGIAPGEIQSDRELRYGDIRTEPTREIHCVTFTHCPGAAPLLDQYRGR